MAGLLDTARPLDRFRTLLAPDPGWQYGSLAPLKTRTPLDPIYGAPQVMDTQFSLAIPDMAREMAGSLLTTLEAPYTGVMPKPADLLNITPMTSAPGLLFRAPAGAGPVFASGLTRRGVGDNQGPDVRFSDGQPLGLESVEFSPLGSSCLLGALRRGWRRGEAVGVGGSSLRRSRSPMSIRLAMAAYYHGIEAA